MRRALSNLLVAIERRPEYRQALHLPGTIADAVIRLAALLSHNRGTLRPRALLRRTISGIRARAKIHHLYFVLASIDLIAVLMGLYLSHNLNNSFANAIGINQSWNQHFSNLENMRRTMNSVATAKY